MEIYYNGSNAKEILDSFPNKVMVDFDEKDGYGLYYESALGGKIKISPGDTIWSNGSTVEIFAEKETYSQQAKSDNGKPKLTLVPRKIIFDIAKVREYGNRKYGDPENWKSVEKERYRDAAFRHFMAYLEDPSGVDEESGLPHLSHLACNVAFLCELENTR